MSALPDQVMQRKPRSAQLEPLDLPKPPPADPDLPKDRFLNREVSWLEFNGRVLQLAEDPTTPLLERVKFLAIFAGNLDEFFMVRVAGLKRRRPRGSACAARTASRSASSSQQISERTGQLVDRQARCFSDSRSAARWRRRTSGSRTGTTSPRPSTSGCAGTSPSRSSPSSPRWRSTRPTRSPTSPGCRSTSPSSCVTPSRGTEHFARIKVPPNVPRLVPGRGRGSNATYVPLEELIAAHLPQLFPGLEVIDSHVFRVTRNQDIEVEEDEAEDLLRALERELARRRFGPAVRLEVQEDIADGILEVLVRELEVDERDVYRVPGGLLDLSALWALYDLDRTELKDPPHVGVTHPRLAAATANRRRTSSAVLREGDVLAAPPVRLVRDERPALHRAGRGRPQGPGHQADALPHVR